MAAFQSITTNLFVSFNLKHIIKIKEKHKQIIELIKEGQRLNAEILEKINYIEGQLDQLTISSNQIIDQLETINKLQIELKSNLSKKDKNYQNRWAQKHGMKSAVQYLASLSKQHNENLKEIEEKQVRLKQYEEEKKKREEEKSKYESELKSNQKKLEQHESKLKSIENALRFYKSIRNITICQFLGAVFLYTGFIIANINMNNLTAIITCGVCALLILLLACFGYKEDVKLSKNLSLNKPNITTHCYSVLISLSIFSILFKNNIADWISIVFFALAVLMIIYNMFVIEKISNKDKGFYLPIDFICLNLPLLCVMALYIMYFANSNQVLNYVASGVFAVVALMYLATFFWIFKEQKQKVKIDFKYSILVIINVLIFLALALLIVIHLTNIIYIPTEILVFILSTLGAITSPIFKSLFKPTVQDPLEEDADKIGKK